MSYDFNRNYHRRSIRLKGWDYSSPGAYYITMCTQWRRCLFGEVIDGEMVLNEYGEVIYTEWEKLPERFPNIELDEYVIMPNHFHGIIFIRNDENDVGAGFTPALDGDEEAGQPQGIAPTDGDDVGAGPVEGAPALNGDEKRHTIGDIIGAFSSLSSNGCLKIFKSKNEIMGKLFQRNYYEHIIRDEQDLNRIRNYIRSNPANWKNDEHYEK